MKPKEPDAPPSPRPDVSQEQPPKYPYVPAITRHPEFGSLPIHFRAGVTEKFEREYCPHLATWQFMHSAGQDEPPCSFRLSDKNVRGCPTGQERECGLYVMHRINHPKIVREAHIAEALNAKALPFNADPKPDNDPLRKEPETPAWVTE